MINDELNRSKECLSHCRDLLRTCSEELDIVAQKLCDVRERQKKKFGKLLLRTTLNKPLPALQQKEDESAPENNA